MRSWGKNGGPLRLGKGRGSRRLIRNAAVEWSSKRQEARGLRVFGRAKPLYASKNDMWKKAVRRDLHTERKESSSRRW